MEELPVREDTEVPDPFLGLAKRLLAEATSEEDSGLRVVVHLSERQDFDKVVSSHTTSLESAQGSRDFPDTVVYRHFEFPPDDTWVRPPRPPDSVSLPPPESGRLDRLEVWVDQIELPTFESACPTVFWARCDDDGFAICWQPSAGKFWRQVYSRGLSRPDYQEVWQHLGDALTERNRRLGLSLPSYASERRQGRLLTSDPLRDTILFASNTVHAAAVRAFAGVDRWVEQPTTGFAYGLKQEFTGMEIMVGLPEGSQAANLWGCISKGGVPMVKAHYALWGRWYQDQDGGNPGQYVTIDVNQFCSDMGYVPHVNGGYKPERKREAVKILEALTSVEMRAIFTPKGREDKKQRLRGPLWARGMIAEEADRYADLFGANREGNPDIWEPLAFSYMPGAWFANPVFRAYNRAVGKIASGMLRLSNDNDQWAILIGGYLGTLVRTEQYRPLRLRVETILRSINRAQGDDGKRRASLYRGKFEKAMDKLVEVGVIVSWTWAGVDTSEPADMDDPENIAEYYSAEILPRNDWRRAVVVIQLPNEADRKRLEEAQKRGIAAAQAQEKRRPGRPRKSA